MNLLLELYWHGESTKLNIKCTGEQSKFLEELAEQLNDEIAVPSEAGVNIINKEGYETLVDSQQVMPKLKKTNGFIDFTKL